MGARMRVLKGSILRSTRFHKLHGGDASVLRGAAVCEQRQRVGKDGEEGLHVSIPRST